MLSVVASVAAFVVVNVDDVVMVIDSATNSHFQVFNQSHVGIIDKTK
jgi:hypothetical protein